MSTSPNNKLTAGLFVLCVLYYYVKSINLRIQLLTRQRRWLAGWLAGWTKQLVAEEEGGLLAGCISELRAAASESWPTYNLGYTNDNALVVISLAFILVPTGILIQTRVAGADGRG
jgi:hypothetical protein